MTDLKTVYPFFRRHGSFHAAHPFVMVINGFEISIAAENGPKTTQEFKRTYLSIFRECDDKEVFNTYGITAQTLINAIGYCQSGKFPGQKDLNNGAPKLKLPFSEITIEAKKSQLDDGPNYQVDEE